MQRSIHLRWADNSHLLVNRIRILAMVAVCVDLVPNIWIGLAIAASYPASDAKRLGPKRQSVQRARAKAHTTVTRGRTSSSGARVEQGCKAHGFTESLQIRNVDSGSIWLIGESNGALPGLHRSLHAAIFIDLPVLHKVRPGWWKRHGSRKSGTCYWFAAQGRLGGTSFI